MTLVFVAALSACKKEEVDGGWDPIKWKTEVTMDDEHNISVPAEGGTYRFTCTNYGGFWITGILEDGKYVLTTEDNRYIVEGKWCRAEAEGKVLTVVISPNETDNRRSVSLQVCEFDAFGLLIFNQASK